MGLDKAIEHKKEHRKPYRGSKAIDCTCRNHGGCDWCLENRMYARKKVEEKLKKELTEFEKGVIIQKRPQEKGEKIWIFGQLREFQKQADIPLR